MSDTSRLTCVFLVLFAAGCQRATNMDTQLPVGALSLHIVCRGEGAPVVVLDSGLGADAGAWAPVQDDVAKFTQVCAYDRAGLGSSSKAPRPHTNRMMADELAELLNASKLPRPYVLVGHSMGGVNVRLLAAKWPDAVAGVVLVDAMSESQPARYWALVPETSMDTFRGAVAQLPEGTDFDTLVQGLTDVQTADSLGDKPLVVLSHSIEDAPPGIAPETNERMLGAWLSMQEDLSKLSTNHAYVMVDGAHHAIQRDRPGVVVAAIREVVEATRHHRPVDPTAVPRR